MSGHATELVYDIDTAGTVTIRKYADRKKGAVVATLTGEETDDGVVDLALLFEAAPDLLEAARELFAAESAPPSGMDGVRRLHAAREALKAAIAKAEGRQP